MFKQLKKALIYLSMLLFPVTATAVETFYFVGNVDYIKQKIIVSSLDGIVSKIHVRAGSQLEKGQPLFDVQPFDPNISVKQVVNQEDNLEVSAVLLREGEKVNQYESVVRLNKKSDLQIRALSFPPISQKLVIGKDIDVIFDPDGDAYQLKGTISALHNHPVQYGKLSTVEAEISIDNSACFSDISCSRHYKVGGFVKLQFSTL